MDSLELYQVNDRRQYLDLSIELVLQGLELRADLAVVNRLEQTGTLSDSIGRCQGKAASQGHIHGLRPQTREEDIHGDLAVLGTMFESKDQ